MTRSSRTFTQEPLGRIMDKYGVLNFGPRLHAAGCQPASTLLGWPHCFTSISWSRSKQQQSSERGSALSSRSITSSEIGVGTQRIADEIQRYVPCRDFLGVSGFNLFQAILLFQLMLRVMFILQIKALSAGSLLMGPIELYELVTPIANSASKFPVFM